MSFCLPFRRLPAPALYLFSFFTAFSQTYSPVAAQVHQAYKEGVPLSGYALFYPKALDHPQIKAFAPTAQMMVLKEDELIRLYREQPPVLQLHLPYKGAVFTLEFVRIDPLTDDFLVRSSTGMEVSTIKPGIRYRGILRGDCCGFTAVREANYALYQD